MTECPVPLRIAAFATDGALDPDIAAHLASCAACDALVAEQREVRALAAALAPPPALTRSHRAALAAEVMARADAADVVADTHEPDDDARTDELGRRRRWIAGGIFATTLAAAAALVIVALTSSVPEPAPEVARGEPAPVPAPVPAPAPAPPRVAPAPVAPPVQRELAGVIGTKAKFSRETTEALDVVRLRDGELAIDALASRAVEIVAGTTRIAIPTSTKATVIARAGVIESVAVFAGSVEVIAGDRTATIEAGAVWERTTIKVADADQLGPAAPTAPTPPARDETAISLQAFRDGWTALRAGDHRTAIAAFDRATDPVVAEDAAYWAAIATERAGDRELAAKRYTDFVARFPASPRAGSARAAIARLGGSP